MEDQNSPATTPTPVNSSPEPPTTPISSDPTTKAGPTNQASVGSNSPTAGKPANHRTGFKMALLAIITVVIVVVVIAVIKLRQPATSPTAPTHKSIALLRVGVTQPFPTSFYPNIEGAIFPIEITSQVFEGLTQYENSSQIEPDLAVSWTNPNDVTWVFKLRPNVKFHDGRTMTATQVVGSLDALENNSYGESYTSTFKSVTAINSSTVQITTNAPDPLLPNELANLFIYDTSSSTPNSPEDGTGPYTLKPGTSLTSNSVDLVAFDGYYGGAPLVKEIDFNYYADTASEIKAIQQNKLDIADLGTQAAVNSVIAYGYSAYADQNDQVNFLMPNTLRVGSPLGKLAVRQAIYEALDPQAIIQAAGGGDSVATQLVPQEIPGYNPAIVRPAYDPTKAKAALAAAGYPNGFSLKFTYYAPQQAIAAEIQKEMAAIGVTLTMDPETSGQVLEQITQTGQTDLYFFGYSTSLIDTSDVAQPLVVDTANFSNPQIDALYNQAQATFNTASRLKLMQQLNLAVMNNVAVMPIFTNGAEYYAVKNNLVIHTNNLATYSGIDFDQVYSK